MNTHILSSAGLLSSTVVLTQYAIDLMTTGSGLARGSCIEGEETHTAVVVGTTTTITNMFTYTWCTVSEFVNYIHTTDSPSGSQTYM